MRVFAAVEIPDDVREKIAAAARELLSGVRAAKTAVARTVAVENLHITVRFVGEVGDAAIDPLCAAVREAAASVECSAAEARGLGAFPNARRPRVVWAGIADPSDVLRRLESSISARLAALGYARENRPYSAHLTVARMREGVRDLGDLTARLAAAERDPPAFGAIPVRAVTVFRSDLGRNDLGLSGSRYTALARFALAKN